MWVTVFALSVRMGSCLHEKHAFMYSIWKIFIPPLLMFPHSIGEWWHSKAGSQTHKGWHLEPIYLAWRKIQRPNSLQSFETVRWRHYRIAKYFYYSGSRENFHLLKFKIKQRKSSLRKLHWLNLLHSSSFLTSVYILTSIFPTTPLKDLPALFFIFHLKFLCTFYILTLSLVLRRVGKLPYQMFILTCFDKIPKRNPPHLQPVCLNYAHNKTQK